MLYHLSYSHHDPPTRTSGRPEVYPRLGPLLEPADSGLGHCPSAPRAARRSRRRTARPSPPSARRTGTARSARPRGRPGCPRRPGSGRRARTAAARRRPGRCPAAPRRRARASSRSASLASRGVMISSRYSTSACASRYGPSSSAPLRTEWLNWPVDEDQRRLADRVDLAQVALDHHAPARRSSRFLACVIASERCCVTPASYRPVSREPALTVGLMTKSPNAGNRVWMARESRLRSGSSQIVGTIGRPAFSRSRR